MEFRLTQLKMQAFRSISDVTLEFNQSGTTVFLGVNGVGKSNSLDCLALRLTWLTNRIRYDLKNRLLLKQKSKI